MKTKGVVQEKEGRGRGKFFPGPMNNSSAQTWTTVERRENTVPLQVPPISNRDRVKRENNTAAKRRIATKHNRRMKSLCLNQKALTDALNLVTTLWQRSHLKALDTSYDLHQAQTNMMAMISLLAVKLNTIEGQGPQVKNIPEGLSMEAWMDRCEGINKAVGRMLNKLKEKNFDLESRLNDLKGRVNITESKIQKQAREKLKADEKTERIEKDIAEIRIRRLGKNYEAIKAKELEQDEEKAAIPYITEQQVETNPKTNRTTSTETLEEDRMEPFKFHWEEETAHTNQGDGNIPFKFLMEDPPQVTPKREKKYTLSRKIKKR